MFVPIRMCLWLVRRLRLMLISFAVGLAAGFLLLVREEQRTWAVRPRDTARELPGDDLIPVADIVDTRSLAIEAAPDEVWPWLVQMGYGRGGWYSYDKLDMDRPSADTILDEFQDLAEGDLVPTHPGGGFVARVVDPGRALVLYLDDALMREQLASLAAESAADMPEAGMEIDMPPFAVSWAFELEDMPGGRTRLVERVRYRIEKLTPEQRRAMPMLSYGFFVLLRSQLLGIRQRAEATAAEGA